MWTVVRLLLATTARPCSASPGRLRPVSCRCPVTCALPPCSRTVSDRPPVMSSEHRAQSAASDSQGRTEPAATPPVPPEGRKRKKWPPADRTTPKDEGRKEGGRLKVAKNSPPRKSPKKENKDRRLSPVEPPANPTLQSTNSPKRETQNERKSSVKYLAKSAQRNSPKQKDQNEGKSPPRNIPKRKRHPSGSGSGPEMSGVASERLATVGNDRQETPPAGVQLLAAIERAGDKAAMGSHGNTDGGGRQPNQQDVRATNHQDVPSASRHQSAPQPRPVPQASGEEMLQRVRVWEPVASQYQAPEQANLGPGHEFTMVSYNVLSQHLFDMHPELYRGARPEDTGWEVRGPRLWAQLLSLQPDIICLQEVEERDIKTFWKPRCRQAGFDIFYKKRTGKDKQDGCAVLFRESVFSLVELATVEYLQPGCRALDRDNVGIVVRLRGAGGDLVVACTHLLYNPKRHDVKLAQVALLLAEVDRLAWCGQQRTHVPILLAGDLNLEPYSPVYRFLCGGGLQYGGMSRRFLTPSGSGERLLNPLLPPELGVSAGCQHAAVQLRRHHHRPTESEPERRQAERRLLAVGHSERRHSPPPLPLRELVEEAAGGWLTHGLRLDSVYRHRTRAGTEATTLQRAWITVDYIFHSLAAPQSSVRLEPAARLALPTGSVCHRLAPFPSAALPSDHLPLAARFRMVPNVAWWPGRYS